MVLLVGIAIIPSLSGCSTAFKLTRAAADEIGQVSYQFVRMLGRSVNEAGAAVLWLKTLGGPRPRPLEAMPHEVRGILSRAADEWRTRGALDQSLRTEVASIFRDTGRSISDSTTEIGRTVQPSAVSQPISGSRVVSLLPENALEFEAMYAKSPTSRDLRVIETIAAQAPHGPIRRTPGSGVGGLLDALVPEENVAIIIVGHSEDGGRIVVLPSGERMSIVDIYSRCAEREAWCIVVSCRSRELGFTHDLTYKEGIELALAAHEGIQSGLVHSYEDAVRLIRARRHIQHAGRELTIVSLETTGATTAASSIILNSTTRPSLSRKVDAMARLILTKYGG